MDGRMDDEWTAHIPQPMGNGLRLVTKTMPHHSLHSFADCQGCKLQPSHHVMPDLQSRDAPLPIS